MRNLLKALKGAKKISERYYEGEGTVVHYLTKNKTVIEVVAK
jgi:hypothetical protein